MAEQATYLGIDIGGTKVAAGLVNSSGDILHKVRVPMNGSGSAEDGFASVEAAVQALRAVSADAKYTAIGVSAPGPLDPHAGVILNTPNLTCWRNFRLGDRMRTAFHLPVRIANDADAAGLAEATWGAGMGKRIVFYATMGTGVGTALILDGKIYNGRSGVGPEAGHVIIDMHGDRCGCGKRGCIEALASGTGIARRARTRIASNGTRSMMLDLVDGDLARVSSEIVAQAWRSGDPLATEVLRETAEFTSIWLGSIIDMIEPEIILFGGGIGELYSEWFPYMREVVPKWSIIESCGDIPLALARYKADAGIAGAAALCVAM